MREKRERGDVVERNVLSCVTRMRFHGRQGSVSTDGAVDGCGEFGEIC